MCSRLCSGGWNAAAVCRPHKRQCKHSTGTIPGQGAFPGIGLQQGMGYGNVGLGNFGQVPGIGYGLGVQNPYAALAAQFIPGLSHTAGVMGGGAQGFMNPAQWLTGSPFGVGGVFGGQVPGLGVNPIVSQALAGQGYGIGMSGINPWQTWAGISHSSPELETIRAAATFPYAFSAVSPFVGF